MKTIKSLLILITTLFITYTNIHAQPDLSQPAPVDPDIRMGKLESGLTYFIRKNKEPEKRASFYIIQNVGAILERDDQNGLAHFLEHMAFNGTYHFPGKEIINSLEKHGVAFGRNINAYTGFDETVYNLTNVPVDAPELIDTCLLILNDWSDYITLSDEEIDLERGVISEEWRTSKTASRRMIFKVIPVILKGSKYAKRDIIGDIDIIKTFPYDTLRSFYHDWYRTDLQAIAIVGDIDVDEVEKKVKTLFSTIKAVDNPLPRLQEKVPYHKETYYVLAEDKEAPSTSVSVITLQDAIHKDNKNREYLREQHLISLMNSMINTRISELLQKNDPPFISGYVAFSGYYAREYDAFSISATARKNEETIALRAIYTEAERARRYGFNESELKRAKAIMLSSFENYFKEKDKIDNDTYVRGIQNYFLTGEPLTSIDFDFEFLKEVIDSISAEEISAKFRDVMRDDNRTIVVQGLEGDDIIHLSEQEALNIISEVKSAQIDPYQDEALQESLIDKELIGSKIVKTRQMKQFGAVEWTLANNVKVVCKKADYEKDNILLSAFSFGGVSKLNNDQIVAARLLSSVFPMYGAGDYDNITLQKMLAGKKVSLSVSLNETSESITGSSTPKDFETLMQLLYLKIAEPRFDSVAHAATIGRIAAAIGNMEKDPGKIKRDSIALITTDYNPRTIVLTKDKIESVTLDDIRTIFFDRFGGADEFTFFIVGNIDEEEVIPMVEKYIGSLPVNGRKETWIDRKIEQPEGKVNKEIAMPLTIPKSTVFLSYEKDMKYTPHNYLTLEVIEGILEIVYIEKVREDEGGTYGVRVSLSTQKRPEQTANGIITFDCDPARANDLKAIIYKEIDNMIKDGPSKVNLEKTVSNMLKTREENKMHNSYWSSILSRYYSYGINSDDPKNYEDILKSLTVKDIQKEAKKMFINADLVDIVFKPLE